MNKQDTLRPADVVAALWLAGRPDGLFEEMSDVLAVSLSAAHRSAVRLSQAGLLLPDSRRVNRSALSEFLVHGVRYVFPPLLGPEARGLPTAGLMPEIRSQIPEAAGAVWPFVDGDARGASLVPLLPTMPKAALRDPQLYRIAALVELIRIGQSRERDLGAALLTESLKRQ